MSEEIIEDVSHEKPRRVFVKRKQVVIAKAADEQPSLGFQEGLVKQSPQPKEEGSQDAQNPVAAEEKPEAPVIIERPRRRTAGRRPKGEVSKAASRPETEAGRTAAEKPSDASEQSSETKSSDGSAAYAEEPRENRTAAAGQETTASDATEQGADDSSREQRFRQGGKQHGGKGFQRSSKQFSNRNNQKKSVTMDDVCISLEEYAEHKDKRLLIGNLAQANPSDLKETLAGMTGVPVDNYFDYKKQDVMFEIVHAHIQSGGTVYAIGTLEVLAEGYGFLRSPNNSYLAGPEDVYVSSMHIKYLNLKTGDTIEGVIRAPKENEKYFALSKIAYVNDDEPVKAKTRASFDSLTPLYPDERINLEVADPALLPSLTGMSNDSGGQDVSMRIINLFCPIGKGQRALIIAPPRTGKTILLQQIANSITASHPEITLMVLLVDERPEEVTDMRRNVRGEVIASTFDEQSSRHVQVAEMVIEKAKRLVEHKKDVVILLDSITRLARAYNQTVPASGKILSGGVDSNALHKPKRFFGAARNVEEGGSLTIIASGLIETGSRMDEVIFEEFKGTGNSEIVLDRRMAERRVFPAINIKKSGTRREELLLDKDEAARIWILRNAINNFEDLELTEFLIDKIRKTKNNEMFLRSMNPGVAPA